MNAKDKVMREKVREFFVSKGFVQAKLDTDVKVDRIPGLIDIQIQVPGQGKGNYEFRAHVHRPSFIGSRKLAEILKCCGELGMAPICGEHEDDMEPGLRFRLDTGILVTSNLNSVGDGLVEKYLAYRRCILAKLPSEEGDAHKQFVKWVLANDNLKARVKDVDAFLSQKKFSVRTEEKISGNAGMTAYDAAAIGEVDGIEWSEKLTKNDLDNNITADVAKSYVDLFNNFCAAYYGGEIAVKQDDADYLRCVATRHIVETFEHTECKDYENYVVLGIWHALRRRDVNVRPVTQQFVARGDGDNKRAFIDLYFPAIKVCVECDEAHHLGQKDADSKRQKEICDALKIPNGRFFRVDASMDYMKIDEQICHIAEAIEKIAKGCKNAIEKDWRFYSPIDAVAELGVLEVERCLAFNSDAEALSALRIPRTILGDSELRVYPYVREQSVLQVAFVKDAEVEFTQDKELAQEKEYAKNLKWRDVASGYASAIRLPTKYENLTDRVLLFASYKDRVGQEGYRFLGEYEKTAASEFRRQSMSVAVVK